MNLNPLEEQLVLLVTGWSLQLQIPVLKAFESSQDTELQENHEKDNDKPRFLTGAITLFD